MEITIESLQALDVSFVGKGCVFETTGSCNIFFTTLSLLESEYQADVAQIQQQYPISGLICIYCSLRKKKKIHFYFPFSSLVDSVRYFTLHILIFQCCRKVSRCSTFVVQYLLQQLYCCIYVVLFVIRKQDRDCPHPNRFKDGSGQWKMYILIFLSINVFLNTPSKHEAC